MWTWKIVLLQDAFGPRCFHLVFFFALILPCLVQHLIRPIFQDFRRVFFFKMKSKILYKQALRIHFILHGKLWHNHNIRSCFNSALIFFLFTENEAFFFILFCVFVSFDRLVHQIQVFAFHGKLQKGVSASW